MSKLKRILAILLAVLLVSQSPLSVIAETTLTSQNTISNVSIEQQNGARSTVYVMDDPQNNMIQSVNIKVDLYGDGNYQDISALGGQAIPANAAVDISITYDPSNIVLNVGDQIVYQLPEQIAISSAQQGPVTMGSEEVGTCTIDTNGYITILFTNEEYLSANEGTLSNGTIRVKGNFNEEAWNGNPSINIGGIEIEVPLEEKTNLDIEKSISENYLKQERYLEYTIKVTADYNNTKTVEGVYVTDGFTSGAEYVESIHDAKEWVDNQYKYGANVPGFDLSNPKWNIGNLAPGETATLVYKVKVNDSYNGPGTTGSHYISNTAYVYDNSGYVKDSDYASTSASSDLYISKSGGLKNGVVTYTIKVEAPTYNDWTVSDVVVSDRFTSGSQFVEKYEKFSDGTNNTTVVVNEENKTFEWTVGTINPGETKTLTYDVAVNDRIYMEDVALTNRAKINVNGREAEFTVEDFEIEWIAKKGEPQSDGRVKFTVTSDLTMLPADKTAVISDKISSADWVIDGSITVKKGNSYPEEFEKRDDTSWSYKAEGGYTYEFTYYAKYNGTSLNPVIKNKAKLESDLKNDEVESITTVTELYPAIGKYWSTTNDNIATWVTEIRTNIAAGSVYQDYNGYTYYYGTFSFTDEQIQNINVYDPYGRISQDDYEIRRVDNSSFEILFKNDIKGISTDYPISISYSCTLDTEEIPTGQSKIFYNNAELTSGSEKAESVASCNYKKQRFISKTAGEYDERTQLLTWTITVNQDRNLKGDYNIIDTLPEGLEFVSAEKIPSNIYLDKSYLGECGVDASGKVKIEIKSLSSYKLDIKIVTRVVDSEFFAKNNETRTFTNNATLYDVNNTEVGSASATKTITNHLLTKSGLYDSTTAPDVDYTIVVNPTGQDLSAGDTVKLVDIMGKGMMLKTSTLRIVDGDGNEVAPVDAKLTIETNENKETVFTLTLQDETTYTITYSVYVAGAVGSTMTASNKAYLEGQDGAPAGDDPEIEILETLATIGGKPFFYIVKKDMATFEKLSGATFTLHTVNLDGSINMNPINTGVTDKSGQIMFNLLDENTVYAFRETAAPDGYYVNEVNDQFSYVAFSANAITEQMRAVGIDESCIIQIGIPFERYNPSTKLTLDKAFGDTAINDGTYYIGIFKNGTLVQNTEVVVKNGVSTPVTVEGLSFGTYDIYETDEAGNRLSTATSKVVTVNGVVYEVSGEGSVTISQDTPTVEKTITNTKVATMAPFKGTKLFENAAAANKKEFTFGLYAADSHGNATGTVLDTVTITASTSATAFVLGEDLFKFKPSDAGKTFKYVIKEEIPAGVTVDNPTKDGITYDFTKYVIDVAVSGSADNGVTIQVSVDGKELTKTNGYYVLPVQSEGSSFVNNYDVETSIKFAGTKTLTNAALTEDAFTFVITDHNKTDENGNPLELEVGHNADGTIKFPEIFYELADLEGAASKEFTYTVTEKLPEGVTAENPVKDGITYSTASYTVVVTVTNTGASLTAVASTNAAALNFTNLYEAKADTTVEGKKKLNGATLDADEFSFVITEVGGEYTETVKNDADGNFVFNLPTYTQADAGKTFVYEVREVKGDALGVTYSTVMFTVEVTVTDNGDGTLTITKEVTKGNEEVEAIEFTNEFKGSVTLTKYNKDKSKTLEGAEFTLYMMKGETADQNNDTKLGVYTTDKDGKLTVGELAEGKYYFVETKAPAGYDILSKDPIPFEVKQGGESDVYPTMDVINDQKLGTIILEKKAATIATSALASAVTELYGQISETFIKGASFDLYKQLGEKADPATDTKLGSYVTDADGRITVSNLGWGTYYFVETAPAPGYVLDSTPTASITIDAAYVDQYDNAKGEGAVVEKINKDTKYKFAKVDDAATGKYVAEAKLQILDKDGNVVEEWISTDEIHVVNTKLVVGETYTLKEVEVPAGYEFADDVTFTVENTAEVVLITIKDKQTSIEIAKKDENGKLIKGAAFEIREKATNKSIASWDSSDETAYEMIGKLSVNTEYVLTETKAPAGYGYVEPIEFKIVSNVNAEGKAATAIVITKSGKFEANLNADKDGIDVIDMAIELNMNKIQTLAETDGKVVFVPGAELTLIDDATNKEIVSWTSDGENTFDFGPYLEAGKTYTLRETKAPDGYAYVDDIKITVDNKGTVTVELPSEDGAYLVEDAKTKVEINKVDKDGKQLKDAELVIKELDGTEVHRFETKETPELIVGKLVAGKTYILSEVKAPNGYALAGDIRFIVDKATGFAEVTMVDDVTNINITKMDSTGTAIVKGATFELHEDSVNGPVVDTWTSEGTSHVIGGKLKVNTVYVLVETSAPEGYGFVKEIKFQIESIVNAEGQAVTKVVIDEESLANGESAVTEKENGLIVYDKAIDLKLNKVEEMDEGAATVVPVEGAKFSIVDEDGKEVATWISNGDVFDLGKSLKAGKSYTLKETEAPAGYAHVEDIKFTVNKDGSVELDLPVMNGVYLVEDPFTKVEINKVDAEGNQLPGAILAIKDAETDKVVKEFTTAVKAEEIIGELVAGKTYILTEVKAPDGYAVADDIEFTVPTDGSMKPVTMTDELTDFNIIKKDSTGKKVLKGATFELYEKANVIGDPIAAWTSTDEAYTISGLLKVNTEYVLVETGAPDGYGFVKDIEFKIVSEVVEGAAVTKVVIAGDSVANGEAAVDGNGIAVLDKAIEFNINKVEADKETPVKGATLVLLDAEGNVMKEWVSDGKDKGFDFGPSLKAGQSYTLRETAAPDGYAYVKDINFTVNEDGTIDTDLPYVDGTYLVVDEFTKVVISKTDDAGKQLAGAELVIKDADTRKVVYKFETTEKAEEIVGKLVAGKTYILTEVKAPDGYAVADDIIFTVAKEAKVETYTMTDESTNFNIVKKDAAGTKVVEGATFELREKATGEVIRTWITTDEAYALGGVLKVNTEYVLVETGAPDGYGFVKDIEFKIISEVVEGKAVTKVVLSDETLANGEAAVNSSASGLIVYDKAIELNINKVEADKETPVKGAELTLYDAEGKVVKTWISDGESTFDFGPSLKAGQSYTLKETVAPDGYAYAKDINITVNVDGTVNVDLPYVDGAYLVVDEFTKVVINKVNAAGIQLEGAELVIKDAETGEVVKEITTTEKAEEIIGELVAGKTYILSEVKAPDGYAVADDIKFEVAKDGTVVTRTMVDEVTNVSITKMDATGTNVVKDATFELYEKDKLTGDPIETWTSSDTSYTISGVLKVNTEYVLKEIIAPTGYGYVKDIEFQIVSEVVDGKAVTKVVIDKDSLANGESAVNGTENGFFVFDKAIELNMNKVEVRANTDDEVTAVKGAELTLYDAKGNVVVTWISDGEAGFDFGPYLKAGQSYTLKETAAPDGYAYAADINFTVNADGSVDIDLPSADGTYLVEDAKTKVVINKVDAEGKQLAGAGLVIKDANTYEVVKEFTTTDKAEEIVGELVAGKTYILSEVNAPAGYAVADDILFTVAKEAKDVVVTMSDAATNFNLVKKDSTGTIIVPDATFEIREKATGELVDTWVSTEDVYALGGLLKVNTEYVLTETIAPVGYGYVKDIEFQIVSEVVGGKAVTKVVLSDETLANGESEVNETADGIVVFDKAIALNLYKVETIEEDAAFVPVAGAELTIYDEEGNVVVIWISDGESAVNVGSYLEAGKNYTLTETKAPEGYAYRKDIAFSVEKDGTVKMELPSVENTDGAVIYLVENAFTKVVINKVDPDGKQLAGAHMVIIDVEAGTVIKEFTTTANPEEIIGELVAGKTYILAEKKAPEGYELAKEVEFTVPLGEEAIEVTMVDQLLPPAVNTGDHSNLPLYLLLMFISVAAGGATFFAKRRRYF